MCIDIDVPPAFGLSVMFVLVDNHYFTKIRTMKNKVISDFELQAFPQTKTHPKFRPGDTIRIHYKVEEGVKGGSNEKKYRIQQFEGVCLRFRKGWTDSSFTVRRIGANNIGVERVFAYHSPLIDKIDLVTAGVVRRARLYYLRNLAGKAARIRTRRLPEGTLRSSLDPNAEEKKKKSKAKASSSKAK